VSDERKRSRLSTAAIAGIVALVTGFVTLLFTLYPGLRPDPGEAISAKLSVVTIERHARYSAYLKRLGDAAPKVDNPDVLAQVGFIVNLGVTVNGRKRQDVKLRHAAYVANSDRRFNKMRTIGEFKSETPSDTWIVPVFVVHPGPKFFERFELYDGDTLLALADTHDIKAEDPSG
jgi:hypothetical protein